MISKELFLDILLKNLESVRGFLKGKEEAVISKDLLYTLNSRYVYLPQIWMLIPHEKIRTDFSSAVLYESVKNAMEARTAFEKGIFWEDACTCMLKGISQWRITGRRIRAGSQEIDIGLANVSTDNAFWKLGAFLLAECKNWRNRVGSPQIRNLAQISERKGNKSAILFAARGITKDAEKEIARLAASDLSILCVTAEDLLKIRNAKDCEKLILKKWEELQEFDICGFI